MRVQKFALLVFLTIFLAFSVSAATKQVALTVDVTNSEGSHDPVSGASVRVELKEPPWTSWDLTTDSSGEATFNPTVSTYHTYYFDIDVSATGFVSESLSNVDYTSCASSTCDVETIAYIDLEPIDVSNCNNNGTCDPGETSGTCPADCPDVPDYPVEGIVKSAVLHIGGLTDQCPSGTVTKGEFNTGATYLAKLCVEFINSTGLTNELVLKSARVEDADGEIDDWCLEDDEVPGATFLSGSQYKVLCKSSVTLVSDTDKPLKQHVLDVFVTNSLADCTASYNMVTGPFRDYQDNLHYLCAKVANYVDPSDAECNLTTPLWVYADASVATRITGWAGTSTGTGYDYQYGDRVYLIVNAPGCNGRSISFDVYQGPVADDHLKFVLSPAFWSSSGGGRAEYYWGCSLESIVEGSCNRLPQWEESTGYGTSPTDPVIYSFKAKVQGTDIESVFSAPLSVNKPLDAECHYDPNSEADDVECGDGMKCAEGNICVDNSCTTDPNSCGEGFCDPDTLNCVECYNNTQCVESQGEGYLCNLVASSGDDYHTCYFNDSCTFSELTWRWAENGDEIILEGTHKETVVGWIDEVLWQHGGLVGLAAHGEGCEGIGDIVFVIKEKNFFVDESVAIYEPNVTRESRYFAYSDPPWEPIWFNTAMDWFFEGGQLEYYFYMASASDPNTPLKGGISGVLNVIGPEPAECQYDDDSDDDDAECVDNDDFGEGYRCSSRNTCVPLCSADEPCEDDLLCSVDGTPEGTTQGMCYGCFEDDDCADTPTTPSCSNVSFQCVECIDAEDCRDLHPEGNESMFCGADNTCTSACNPANGNADCAIFASGLTADEIWGLSLTDRAARKGNTVCHADLLQCVQCNANYDPQADEDVCEAGGCCFVGTACKVDEGDCVQCIEDSICVFGTCNEDNECVFDLDLGGFGGIVVALLGALVGFMIGGPPGAIAGGLLGLLVGGGLGGDGGMLGGLGDLFGGGDLLGMLMGFLG
ncbi:MAG: hypothetical protein ABH864_00365 [archaeon]